MDVYMLAGDGLPSTTVSIGPFDRLDDGPNGSSRLRRTTDGGPNAGKVLCRTAHRSWEYVDDGDPYKMNNGVLCRVVGTVFSFNPQPGGVEFFFGMPIPNA